MKRRFVILLALLIGSAIEVGCAAVGLTLLGVGAGISGGTGLSYTLDSIAYKTFTVPEDGLRTATLKSLKRMDMKVNENQSTDSGRRIVAEAGDRTVEIELDRLTTKTSRMRVTVKQGWFFKDRATAAEIVVQTEHTLEGESRPTQKVTSSAGASALKK